jgi:hypothetical protein
MLLLDGRTAHSQFEIPLELTKQTTCNIPKQSKLARLLQTVDLIIWDEAPMMHKYAFEALNRTLQDIRNSNLIMGGIITVLCGDFQQILPIIPKGSRTDIIQATLKESYLWKHVKCLKLNENMRLTESSKRWNEFLLAIGEGRYPSITIDEEDYIQLPESIVLGPGKTLNDLISFVFKDQFYDNNASIILTPKSKDAQKINDMIVNQYATRNSYEYNSADCTEYINEVTHNLHEDGQDEYYPTELLNSINPSGMPPHSLTLKVGIPIILIRSIAPKAGLYNGTRLRIDSLQSKIVTATIVTGRCIGKQVKLPRIDCYYKSKELPFTLIRQQFPILIAFALTINRSEGQGFENLGIYLPSPVFSHGQLYVGLSRCTSIDRLKVLIEHNKSRNQEYQSLTKNIVYPEIFYT